MTIMKYRTPVRHSMPVDRLANEIFGPHLNRFFGSDQVLDHSPRVNIVEHDEAYHVAMQVPGFGKDELKVEVNGDSLTIRGEHNEQAPVEGRWARREFKQSSFERTFTLPKTIQSEAITADHQNGVLTLVIPKIEESRPKTRQISIG